MRPRIAALALTACTAAAMAADGAYESARRVTQQAQALQEQGRWADARTQLEAQVVACGSEAACRLLVLYTQAFLAERQARRMPDQASTWLDEATTRYRSVLREAPQHEATLKNLALIEAERGHGDEALSLLQRAAGSDAALLLGQLQREAGHLDAALATLQRAAAANAADAAAPQAIVALYGDAPPERLDELLPRLAEWSRTLPAVAERGYRLYLTRAAERPQAELALMAWVSLIARQGWVSAATFAGLPRGWSPLEETRRYVAVPEEAPAPGGWCTRQPLRRSVLAELALALAEAPEARADPRRAQHRLEVGLAFCPRYDDYLFSSELKAAWPARMELARALLSLLSRQPALDPGDRRQRNLVGELFEGKAGAYRSENLAAMQRFHVTLGRWYAERNEWSSGVITNARFQLEHAIDTAEQRFKRGEPYQPLQEEKEMLAGGYRQIGELAKARSMYLQAAAAFLDTDQLEPARRALEAAQRITEPAPTAAEAAQAAMLNQIVDTRSAIAEAAVVAGFEGRQQQRWLQADGLGFVKRQQFKVWADLTLQARNAAQEEVAAQRAGTAFRSALALDAMVGTADLVRLEGVKALATARADLDDRHVDLLSVRPVAPKGAAWSLYVPAENRVTYVCVSADAVLAGRFDAALRSQPGLAGKDVRFSVDDGIVKLFVPGGQPVVVTTKEQLQRVEGVRSLSIGR